MYTRSNRVPPRMNIPLNNGQNEITALLNRISAGDGLAEGELLPLVYAELHRMAATYLRGERKNHTLQATALVHEAYLRMAGRRAPDWQGRDHFFAASAQAMRRILTDYARSVKASKRGGEFQRLELDELTVAANGDGLPFDELDEALDRLAKFAPRQARVVELRFFGGLTEGEIASYLKVSSRTVKRDWNVARAWLYGELGCPGRQP